MKSGLKYILFAVSAAALVAVAVAAYRHLSSVTPAPSDPPTSATSPSSADESVKPDASGKEKTAPDFTVTDGKGRKVTLSESFGRPVILNFWATWCPPCRSELPAFEKLYRKYQAEVTFMMIDLSDGYRETPDSVKKFLSENGYTFPVYYDSEGSAAKAYNALSIPFTVAIDKKGNVKKTHLGAMSEAALESIIKSLIEAK